MRKMDAVLWGVITSLILICAVQGAKIYVLADRIKKLETAYVDKVDIGSLELTDSNGNVRFVMSRDELIDIIHVQASLLKKEGEQNE